MYLLFLLLLHFLLLLCQKVINGEMKKEFDIEIDICIYQP